MDLFAILEQFGVPVAMCVAFGYFIFKQNSIVEILASLSGNGLKEKFLNKRDNNY